MKQFLDLRKKKVLLGGEVFSSFIPFPVIGATGFSAFLEQIEKRPEVVEGVIAGILTIFFLLSAILLRKKVREARTFAQELELSRKRLHETQTELKRAQEELTVASLHHDNLLNNAQVGIFRLDLEGTCTYMNQVMEKLSGLYQKKAAKDGLASVIHPDDREEFEKALGKYLSGKQFSVSLSFRFTPPRGKETRVLCQINRLQNQRRRTVGYIGWVTDVTPIYRKIDQQKAITDHFRRFLIEGVEGYYHLAPEEPLANSRSTDEMAKQILSEMRIVECADSFAAIYEATPEELQGQALDALSGGCGPLKNLETIRRFIESGYKQVGQELIRFDSHGNRLVFISSIIGIFEEDRLVGIWGALQNITHMRQKEEELSAQVHLLHRIFDTIPLDVYAKDVHCRFLFANKKFSARTGVPKEDFLGKTLPEVVPHLPKDVDQADIEVMRSGKVSRKEQICRLGRKPEWVESIQIPLVSKEGIVEGVVGVSLGIETRKKQAEQEKKEYEAARKRIAQLEKDLKKTKEELNRFQEEFGQEHSKRERFEEHLKKARQLLEHTRKRMESLTSDLQRLQGEKKQADARLQQALQQIKRLEAEVTRLREREKELRERLRRSSAATHTEENTEKEIPIGIEQPSESSAKTRKSETTKHSASEKVPQEKHIDQLEKNEGNSGSSEAETQTLPPSPSVPEIELPDFDDLENRLKEIQEALGKNHSRDEEEQPRKEE